jgi:hypothetical protein
MIGRGDRLLIACPVWRGKGLPEGTVHAPNAQSTRMRDMKRVGELRRW